MFHLFHLLHTRVKQNNSCALNYPALSTTGTRFDENIKMEQLNLFGETQQNNSLLPGLLDYVPGLFDPAESEYLMQKFIREMPWQQRSVLMYGKEVITPRLTVWYGDQDADYSVTGDRAIPLPWTEELLMIKNRIEPLAGIRFNTVLLNYYRDGNDSVSWHSDNDGVPGKNRIVASVSFGQARNFDVREKDDHAKKYTIELQNGSYLLMKGNFQDQWQHRIAKSTKPMKPRINLTFRILKVVE
ncbi:MAG: alpha-ketoglutarate-dependent dioxygenase AlkB [Mucilaginibacter sp.]|nr:alpha-ketoglutarate-dependent dioxygenase AlkB [Mucilaginibacter sp.]